jgi:hypothetical protein
MLAVLHCARFNGDAVHFPFNASFFGQYRRMAVKVELA